MLTPRDLDNMRSNLEKALHIETTIPDPAKITFHFFKRTSSGGGVARHFDNAPLDPWNSDSGFSSVGLEKTLPCVIIPKIRNMEVEDLNIVQEGYHPDSDLEVIVTARSMSSANISINNIRNSIEYVSMPYPHTIDKNGRPYDSINRLWSLSSVRPHHVANQVYAVTLGLSLREQDDTKASVLEE